MCLFRVELCRGNREAAMRMLLKWMRQGFLLSVIAFSGFLSASRCTCGDVVSLSELQLVVTLGFYDTMRIACLAGSVVARKILT